MLPVAAFRRLRTRLGIGAHPPHAAGGPPASRALADPAAALAGSVAEIVASLDLGIADIARVSRQAYDVPLPRVPELLASTERWCAARGQHALIQRDGTIVPIADALSALSAAGRRQGQDLRHLRVLVMDPTGQLVENLLVRVWRKRRTTWRACSPLAPVARVARTHERPAGIRDLPLDSVTDDEIDAVFTWVDGSDPAWRALIAPYRALDEADADRYVQVDELRFALRSLDLFAPWFRRVFVFSNCAPPAWFRPTDRVTWVDHSEVIPAEQLPLFSSHPIETWLHRIPGLSERFVYFNDDMMLWDSVLPSTFFTAAGRSIVHFEPGSSVVDILDRDAAGTATTWQQAIATAARLLRERQGMMPTRLHQHSPYALRRSVLEEIEEDVPDVIARVRASRFREPTDVSLVSFYHHHHALARGQAVEAHAEQVMLRGVNHRDPRVRSRLPQAVFVCINDGAGSGTDIAFQRFKGEFLGSYLVVPSTAEDAEAPFTAPPAVAPPSPRKQPTSSSRAGSPRAARSTSGAGSNQAPVFIVGTARSGTSLLAAMVGTHSAIACGPETAVFLHLDRSGRRIVRDPAWPALAVRYLTELRRPTMNDPVLEHFGLTPVRVREELVGREPSTAALLEAITVPYMRDEGKRRWAEKTPGHLHALRLIRRQWPDARIIRVVRDPRGNARSLREPPFERSAVKVAYQWRFDDAAWRSFAEHDHRALSIRYEDLVGDPEGTLREVCSFIGEEYEPAMVTSTAGRSKVIAEAEAWHARLSRPVDASRATAWREELSADDRAIVEMVCHGAMEAYGYEGTARPTALVEVHPWVRALGQQEELITELARVGIVARGPGGSDGTPSAGLLLVGRRAGLDWTAEGHGGLRGWLRWGRRLAVARLRGRPALWLDQPLGPAPRHRAAGRAADRLLCSLTVQVTPGHVAERLER